MYRERARTISASLILLALSVEAQVIDPQAILNEVRRKVESTVQSAPRYTCVETIERYWYANRKVGRPGCDADHQPEISGRNLVRSDRLRLDVAVGSGQEIFSWHGQESFQTDEIDELVTAGPVSSGSYFSFLSSIFLEGIAKIDFRGLQGDVGKQVAVFGYSVPLRESHFETRTARGKEAMGYNGEFTVDPTKNELRQLDIDTDDMPETALFCAFSSKTRYEVTILNGVAFQLPASVAADILYQSHERARTITQYRECREFSAESVLRFGDVPKQDGRTVSKSIRTLPAGLAVRIRIKTGIDPNTAWTGDPVEGELATDIVDGQGKVLAARGAPAQGILIRLETGVRPSHFYTAALKFRNLSAAGEDYRLNLKSLAEPLSLGTGRDSMPSRIQLDTPPISDDPAACRFRFNDKHIRLKGVVTYWVTN